MSLFPDAPHHIGRSDTAMLEGSAFASSSSDAAQDESVHDTSSSLHCHNDTSVQMTSNTITNNVNHLTSAVVDVHDHNKYMGSNVHDNNHNHSHPDTMLWATDDSRTHGMFSYSAVGGMHYAQVMNNVAPYNTPVSWPSSTFSSTTSPIPSQSQSFSFRKDSLCPIVDDDAENPWQSLSAGQTITVDDDLCPSPSSHSCSSRPSAISSPYSHPDLNMYPQIREHSPMVKLEDHSDYSRFVRAGPWSVPAMAPGLIRPDDLMVDGNCQPLYGHGAHSPFSIRHEDEGKPMIYDSRIKEPKSCSVDRMSTDLYMIPRRKRILTKPENASCACDICGKLFQRAYNLKAHMLTHDPLRDQPHACVYPLCSRRFVRKTDLLRHEQSVHVKSRNYACSLCDAAFSRKDTLRRHIDDGCARRPEFRRRMLKSRRGSDLP